MKKHIRLIDTTHVFRKQNLVTISDRSGIYDKMRCELCGLEGKRHGFETVVANGSYHCPKAEPKSVECEYRFIQILTIATPLQGPFKDLKPGTVHAVVESPQQDMPNGKRGYWIMGYRKRVLILHGEFIGGR